MLQLTPQIQPQYNSPQDNPLLAKDTWEASELGLEPARAHGSYFLNFDLIFIEWLKVATKRFVLLQSATKSYSTCKSYIDSIVRLMNYVQEKQLKLDPEDLTRELIIGFLTYLSQKKYSASTRGVTLSNIRTLHTVITSENWYPCSLRPIVHETDFPKRTKSDPRFIPDFVMKQFLNAIKYEPEYMQNFLTVLMESGRRVVEICSLPFDCLEQDQQNDWYLRVEESKMKKIRLLPISQKCVDAIQRQQKSVESSKSDRFFLFPSRAKHKSPHLSARFVNETLGNMSEKHDIRDVNGSLWKFSAHQFRHTVGTNMINNGVPQIMVQEYLGHESSEMTARYAHIHNETLKNEFVKYQDKMIDIYGEPKALDELQDGKWLKANIASQSLPNGLCTLPMTQQKCPHANACLTCANFRTSSEYLVQHKKQLDDTLKIIDDASQKGWQRVVESNTTVAKNLKRIIVQLET